MPDPDLERSGGGGGGGEFFRPCGPPFGLQIRGGGGGGGLDPPLITQLFLPLTDETKTAAAEISQ